MMRVSVTIVDVLVMLGKEVNIVEDETVERVDLESLQDAHVAQTASVQQYGGSLKYETVRWRIVI